MSYALNRKIRLNRLRLIQAKIFGKTTSTLFNILNLILIKLIEVFFVKVPDVLMTNWMVGYYNYRLAFAPDTSV